MTYQHSTLDHHSLPNLTSNTFGGVRGGVLGIQSGDSLLSSVCVVQVRNIKIDITWFLQNQTFKIHFINFLQLNQLWSTLINFAFFHFCVPQHLQCISASQGDVQMFQMFNSSFRAENIRGWWSTPTTEQRQCDTWGCTLQNWFWQISLAKVGRENMMIASCPFSSM